MRGVASSSEDHFFLFLPLRIRTSEVLGVSTGKWNGKGQIMIHETRQVKKAVSLARRAAVAVR